MYCAHLELTVLRMLTRVQQPEASSVLILWIWRDDQSVLLLHFLCFRMNQIVMAVRHLSKPQTIKQCYYFSVVRM